MGQPKSGSVYDELGKVINAPIDTTEYCFDYSKFQQFMSSPDPIALILKGHLFVKYILIRHIEMSFGPSGDIDADRMNFPLKVALVYKGRPFSGCMSFPESVKE